jgi:hypothetical protein
LRINGIVSRRALNGSDIPERVAAKVSFEKPPRFSEIILFLRVNPPNIGHNPETLYRAPAGWSKTYTFPVKDWIECDGGWSGRVTYRHVKVNDSRMTKEYR